MTGFVEVVGNHQEDASRLRHSIAEAGAGATPNFAKAPAPAGASLEVTASLPLSALSNITQSNNANTAAAFLLVVAAQANFRLRLPPLDLYSLSRT